VVENPVEGMQSRTQETDRQEKVRPGSEAQENREGIEIVLKAFSKREQNP